MLALSIRQPWASLILKAGKDIENRCWQTKVRGRVLIHAAKGGLWARKRGGCQSFDGLSDFNLALSIIFLTQLGPPRAVSFSFCSWSIRTPTTTVSSPSLMGFRP